MTAARVRPGDPGITARPGQVDCGAQHHEVLEGGELIWTCDAHDHDRDVHRTALTIDGRYAKMWRTPNPDDSMSGLLADQWEWSQETFGPGRRTGGVLAHIRKELDEIEADPTDVEEWVDVAGLALDGACRAGHTPAEVVEAWRAKIAKNRARSWPDWRTASEDEPIEHDR